MNHPTNPAMAWDQDDDLKKPFTSIVCDGAIECDAGRGVKSIADARSLDWRFIRVLGHGKSNGEFIGTCPRCVGRADGAPVRKGRNR